MRGLDGALWLEPRLRELVEVRTAQIDGCMNHLAEHTVAALEAGESPRRLAALAGWRQSPLFDLRERAALALAEAIALLDREAIAAARRAAAAHLDPDELARLTFVCVAAGAWDRLELVLGEEFG
jgi:AhpD family alkylhydroperoxidase